jgi:hypothetical protein
MNVYEKMFYEKYCKEINDSLKSISNSLIQIMEILKNKENG